MELSVGFTKKRERRMTREEIEEKIRKRCIIAATEKQGEQVRLNPGEPALFATTLGGQEALQELIQHISIEVSRTLIHLKEIYSIAHAITVEHTTETEHHSELTRKLLDTRILPVIGTLFRGIEGYATFASTAQYLQGNRLIEKGINPNHPYIKEITEKLPGDLDLVVTNRTALQQIFERLHNLAGHDGVEKVHMDTPHHFEGQDTIRYSGVIDFAIDGKIYPYEFEIFFNDKKSDLINTKEVFRHIEKEPITHGIQVLSLESLQMQYYNNYKFETRIHQYTENLMSSLIDPQNPELIKSILDGLKQWHEQETISHHFSEILRSFNITPLNLARAYDLRRQLEQCTPDDPKRRSIASQIALEIGVTKTKIEKREHAAMGLQNLQALTIETDAPIPSTTQTDVYEN